MTLMHTIVYRSRYQIAPVAVLTTFKAKRLSRINDAFNKIRSEKQMVTVESVRPPPITLYVILSPPHAGEESPKFKYLHT
jgi:hypothetical protein